MFRDEFDMPIVHDYVEPYSSSMSVAEAQGLLNELYGQPSSPVPAPPAPVASPNRWRQDPDTGQWYAESDEHPEASGWAPPDPAQIEFVNNVLASMYAPGAETPPAPPVPVAPPPNPYDVFANDYFVPTGTAAAALPAPPLPPTIGDRLVHAGDVFFNSPQYALDWYADKIGFQAGAPVKGLANAVMTAPKDPELALWHLQYGWGSPSKQWPYYWAPVGEPLGQYLGGIAASPPLARGAGAPALGGAAGSGIVGGYYSGPIWNAARSTDWPYFYQQALEGARILRERMGR